MLNSQNRTACSLLALLLALGLGSCKIRMDIPESFLELERSSTQLKATTPDEALLWVRRFEAPEKSTKLEFWRDALKNDLVGNRGYVLIEEGSTTAKTGREGSEMIFEATSQGETQRYLVAVFFLEGGLLSDPEIYSCEFVATKELFETHLEAVQAAIKTLAF